MLEKSVKIEKLSQIQNIFANISRISGRGLVFLYRCFSSINSENLFLWEIWFFFVSKKEFFSQKTVVSENLRNSLFLQTRSTVTTLYRTHLKLKLKILNRAQLQKPDSANSFDEGMFRNHALPYFSQSKIRNSQWGAVTEHGQ